MSNDAFETLLEIRAIEQLKYRYMRALDTHDWDLMGQTLAKDVHIWLGTGKYQLDGRDKVLAWMSSVMVPSFYSTHIVTHPEIELTSPTTATGVWRLQDIVYFTEANPGVKEGDIRGGEKLEGAAHYFDEYRKTGGKWEIQSTGYIRIFETLTRPDFSGDQALHIQPERGVRPQ